jgi:hypothetical protein
MMPLNAQCIYFETTAAPANAPRSGSGIAREALGQLLASRVVRIG